MEFGLREVLIVVGLVVIAGILVDGYRRVRKSKAGELELPAQMSANSEDEWGMFKGELPNGGARKIAVNSDSSDFAADDQREAFGSALDEPVDEESLSRAEAQYRDFEPQPEARVDYEPDLFAEPEPMVASPKPERSKPRSRAKVVEETQPELALEPDLQEVLVINIMARESDFRGPELKRVLESCGFRHGDMNIYHRFEQHTGRGTLLFSAANVVEPGVFHADQMDQLRTPGICIFMKLPGPRRPIHAFDLLMDSSRKIANLLDADIKDEHHNLMRQQTAEHYRQRVLDFERRYLSLSKAGHQQV